MRSKEELKRGGREGKEREESGVSRSSNIFVLSITLHYCFFQYYYNNHTPNNSNNYNNNNNYDSIINNIDNNNGMW